MQISTGPDLNWTPPLSSLLFFSINEFGCSQVRCEELCFIVTQSWACINAPSITSYPGHHKTCLASSLLHLPWGRERERISRASKWNSHGETAARERRREEEKEKESERERRWRETACVIVQRPLSRDFCHVSRYRSPSSFHLWTVLALKAFVLDEIEDGVSSQLPQPGLPYWAVDLLSLKSFCL